MGNHLQALFLQAFKATKKTPPEPVSYFKVDLIPIIF